MVDEADREAHQAAPSLLLLKRNEPSAMPRAKRGFKARRRRNRVLKHAKGFYASRGRVSSATPSSRFTTPGPTRTRIASCKKRDFRRLWITRISAAAKLERRRATASSSFALKRRASSSIARSWPTSRSAIRVASKRVIDARRDAMTRVPDSQRRSVMDAVGAHSKPASTQCARASIATRSRRRSDEHDAARGECALRRARAGELTR